MTSDTPTPRRVVLDYPTAWKLCLLTKRENHHEKCSYRTDSMLCDCAAMEIAEAALNHNAERAADEAWNEQIRQLKLDAVCSEIPESVTGEDIRLDIADWLDKRLRPIAEGGE